MTFEHVTLPGSTDDRGESRPPAPQYGSRVDMIGNAEYHADKALGKSDLDLVNRSVFHYQRKGIRAETPAMKFGTAFHTAVLEPDVYAASYAVLPPMDRRTKAGKEEYERFLAEHPGAAILSADDAQMIDEMRMSVTAHPIAKQLVVAGEAELSCFWTDPLTSLKCKCRPDYLLLDLCTAIDLKTTEDASPWSFSRSCATYRYNAQQAWYVDGLRTCGVDVDSFIFVAIEKKPPYAVACYTLDKPSVEAGRAWCRRALETIAAYYEQVEAGREPWPGYTACITELTLPAWALDPKEVYYAEV